MEPLQAEVRKLASTEPRMKRYKPVWRFLFISNFALGGYIFAKARKKHQTEQDSKAVKPIEEEFNDFIVLPGFIFAKARKKHQIEQDSKDVKPSEEEKGKAAVEVSSPPISDEPLIPLTAIEPAKVRKPIPEDQQRELFKWMLEEKRKAKQMILEEKRQAKQMISEEKRKAKQKNWEEEKQIDEEKKILKQFIHAKSVPQL